MRFERESDRQADPTDVRVVSALVEEGDDAVDVRLAAVHLPVAAHVKFPHRGHCAMPQKSEYFVFSD